MMESKYEDFMIFHLEKYHPFVFVDMHVWAYSTYLNRTAGSEGKLVNHTFPRE